MLPQTYVSSGSTHKANYQGNMGMWLTVLITVALENGLIADKRTSEDYHPEVWTQHVGTNSLFKVADNRTGDTLQGGNDGNNSDSRKGTMFFYEMMCAVIVPMSYVLNFISIQVFWRMAQTQKQSILWGFIGLCIADSLTTLVPIDYVIWAQTGFSWAQSTDIGCRVIPALSFISRTCSNYFSGLIALERFASVRFPLKVHLWFTKRRVLAMMAAITVCSLASQTYRVGVFHRETYSGHLSACGLISKYSKLHSIIYLVMTIVVGFLLPWALVGILNSIIIIHLNHWRKERKSLGVSKKEQTNHSLTFMFLSMSVFSMLCNIIDFISILIRLGIIQNISIHDAMQVHIAASVLVVFGHSGNFIFFFLTGSAFRNMLISFCRIVKSTQEALK